MIDDTWFGIIQFSCMEIGILDLKLVVCINQKCLIVDYDGEATAHGKKIDYIQQNNCKIMEMNNTTKNICFIPLSSTKK